MPTFKGKAAVYGVDGQISILGAALVVVLDKTNNKVTGATVTDNFPVAKIDTGSGVVALAAGSRTFGINLTIIPWDGSGTTLATAKDNIKLPDKLAVVKVESFGIRAIDGGSGGPGFAYYNYVGNGTITLNPEGYVQVNLPCERYGDDEVTATALQ